MNTIPCIKNKCLKFPVCKSKRHIDCTSLREYYDEVILIQGQDSISGGPIYTTFPNLLTIKLETPPEDSNITKVNDTIAIRGIRITV